MTDKLGAAELLELIRMLPLTTQAVFNLYVIEGFTHKEIGSILEISDGTSKWHLSHARKILQTEIINLTKE
jgi:RNA polymerase sigma-70 factor (ECF subfamily)